MNFPNTARRNLNPPTQGDDAGYRLEFTKGGSPVDISGWTIVFTAKRKKNQDSADLQSTASITDGPGGVADIEFSTTQTESLSGLYYYDIQVDTGSEVQTIMQGIVPFEQDVN